MREGQIGKLACRQAEWQAGGLASNVSMHADACSPRQGYVLSPNPSLSNALYSEACSHSKIKSMRLL